MVILGINEIITDYAKQMTGKLRPHFLAVCDPDFSKFNCTDSNGLPLYVADYTCRGEPKDVIEAR